MKKILYISNYRKGVGGINNQVDMLSSYVRKERFSVDIFSTKGNPFMRILAFFRLIVVARRYDILHIHCCSNWGMLPTVYGVIAGRLWRKRVIVTYHGGDAAEYFQKHGEFARRWLLRADAVIVLSAYLEQVFNRYKIPCVVIPNIIDVPQDVYVRKDCIAPRLISIRQLTSLYNIDLIIKAYQQVLIRYPNATLDILGAGDKGDELKQYVQQHHLRGVRFLGQVSREEIFKSLQQNDIMLSAPSKDNMPLSLLEAMSAGVLVISSRVGGVPYIIEHERTGLLFENGNVEQMAENIIWVLSHQEESLQILENAHAEARRYRWSEIRNKILSLYE